MAKTHLKKRGDYLQRLQSPAKWDLHVCSRGKSHAAPHRHCQLFLTTTTSSSHWTETSSEFAEKSFQGQGTCLTKMKKEKEKDCKTLIWK